MKMRYINVDKVLAQHQNLRVEECNDHTPRRICGTFIMNTEYNDVCFYKQYNIDIDLSDIPPYVVETEGKISKRYPHRYRDGGLCLETTARLKIDCIEENGFNFEIWFNQFLMPYFFTYEYYSRFGEYPFGERSHYNQGVLEYYKEYFHLSSLKQTIAFLQQVSKMKIYRGHWLCPCGSGKRIRECHKNEVINALKPIQRECIIEDLLEMRRETKKVGEYY